MTPARAGPRRRRRGRPAGRGRRLPPRPPRRPRDRPRARPAGRRRDGRLVRVGQRHLRQGAARLLRAAPAGASASGVAWPASWARRSTSRSPARCSGARPGAGRGRAAGRAAPAPGVGEPGPRAGTGRDARAGARARARRGRGRHLHPGRGCARRRRGRRGAAGRRRGGRRGAAHGRRDRRDRGGRRRRARPRRRRAPVASTGRHRVRRRHARRSRPGSASRVPLVESPGALVHTAPQPRRLGPVLLAPEAHVLQRPDGRLVVGRDFAGGDVGLEPAALLAAAAGVLPALAGVGPERRTLCRRVLSADGLPVLGREPGGRAYVMATHSGVSLGPLLGRLVATELLDDVEVDLLAPYRPGAVRRRAVIVRAMTAADVEAVPRPAPATRCAGSRGSSSRRTSPPVGTGPGGRGWRWTVGHRRARRLVGPRRRPAGARLPVGRPGRGRPRVAGRARARGRPRLPARRGPRRARRRASCACRRRGARTATSSAASSGAAGPAPPPASRASSSACSGAGRRTAARAGAAGSACASSPPTTAPSSTPSGAWRPAAST